MEQYPISKHMSRIKRKLKQTCSERIFKYYYSQIHPNQKLTPGLDYYDADQHRTSSPFSGRHTKRSAFAIYQKNKNDIDTNLGVATEHFYKDHGHQSNGDCIQFVRRLFNEAENKAIIRILFDLEYINPHTILAAVKIKRN